MKTTAIALTAAAALGTGALAVTPAAAAPLTPAQLGVAVQYGGSNVQHVSHKGKNHWKNPHWQHRHWGKRKPGWFFVHRHYHRIGLYPNCYPVPGGYYCTY